MTSDHVSYPDLVDIKNCDKEPIHIIGKSQAHGVILACHKESLKITQAGKNTDEYFNVAVDDLLGKPLNSLLGPEVEAKLKSFVEGSLHFVPEEVTINGRTFILLAHISDENLILDFELLGAYHDPYLFQRQLTKILNNLKSQDTIPSLCKEAAVLTKNFFKYDRVMVYKFDEEWNGEVVAEEKEEHLESWLGLHYPASDIPSQSRSLFLKHGIRIIADVNYQPVPIVPELSPVTGKPLDLSRSELRGVSPIHIEYLQNMKVGSSLTAAVIVNGKLWGLIACHHYKAKFVNYYERESCRFLAQIFANEIALKETQSFLKHNETSGKLRESLVKQLHQEEDVLDALLNREVKFTELVSCKSGALILNDEIHFYGEKVPSKEQVTELLNEIKNRAEDGVFITNNISEVYNADPSLKKLASGVIAIIGNQNNYILWFRPEMKELVEWGGNPEKKATYDEEKKRLSPRKSFEKWTQERSGFAQPWKDFDISAVKAFRENISHVIVEKQHKEIKELNERLVQANKELELFNYGLSHDLRAPLRGILGYAQILKEDHSDDLDGEAKELLDTLGNLTKKMDVLIDDILSFSNTNTQKLLESEVKTQKQITEILELINAKVNYPKTEIITQDDLPCVYGDPKMLFQLWSNLITNALKYSGKEEHPKVEIGCEKKDGKNVFFVKDNGIGIKKEHQAKIFDTFSKLSLKSYEGSGIGLAIVKLIIDKHKGKIWVESKPGEGSTFFFTL